MTVFNGGGNGMSESGNIDLAQLFSSNAEAVQDLSDASKAARATAGSSSREAAQAVEKMQEAMARATARSYNSFKTLAPGPVSYFFALLCTLFALPAATLIPSMVPVTGTLAGLAAGSPVLVGVTAMCCDAAISQPRRRFSSGSRKLEALALKLPADRKAVLLKFNRAANGLFLLGDAAALQDRIGTGEGSARHRSRLRTKGLALIDKASKQMGWQSAERVLLLRAFDEGRLPKPLSFKNEADNQLRRVRLALAAPY